MTLRQSNKELYWCWKAIKQRCKNPKCHAYHNYGGRGIKVCEEWEEFEPFLEWALNSGYKKGLDIDRINNNSDYEPSNCRWTTRKSNTNNRRVSLFITVDGIRKTASEWSDITGILHGTIKMWCKVHNEEYASMRIKDALENGYIPKNYAYSHTKKVKHIESGMVFKSIKEASEYFDVSASRLSACINHNNGKHPKGTFVLEIE